MILLDPDARPIIAHRGASGEYPENTMLAFERGIALGADAVEFDVRLSADGVPVVVHDPTVDRTTDGTGHVCELTAHDLASLDAGQGQGIPTVQQVLEKFPDTPFIIEVKEAEVARPLAEVIERNSASSRVLVGSFLHAAMSCFSGIGVRRSASRRETAAFFLSSRIGLALGVSNCDAFTVPAEQYGLRVVDEKFLDSASRRGLPVHVWTVDDTAEAERLRAIGIAGIITNWPDRMYSLKRS